MAKYDDLTKDQKELYNNLKSAIESDVDIADLLRGSNKEDLRRVLTVKQEVTLSDDSKDVLTPLGYAMTFNNSGKKIEAILESIKDEPELLKEVLTAKQDVTFTDGRQGVLTPLGYAMIFNDSYKKIEAILNNIVDQGLLKEILTAQQIVNDKGFTMLQHASYYASECVTVIRNKMKEVGLIIQNEQQPLQSNLQDGDSLDSIPFVAAENENQWESNSESSAEEELSLASSTPQSQQELYGNLIEAIKKDKDNGDIAKLLQDCNEEVLRQVLTVKKEVTFGNGIQETLTLLGYAVNFNNCDEKINVILEHVSRCPDLLKEILTAKQIVDGEECTLLNYADRYASDRYASECVTIIINKMQEIGLLPDQHTSLLTLFDQHKGKVALSCVVGIAGIALVVFALTAPLEFGVACAVGIVGIMAIAASVGIVGKVGYDKVSERAEKDELSTWDAVKSIISDIFSISGKENNPKGI